MQAKIIQIVPSTRYPTCKYVTVSFNSASQLGFVHNRLWQECRQKKSPKNHCLQWEQTV